MTSKIRIFLTCTGLALLAAGPVLAQSGGNVENRLSRLENEIQTLSRALFRGENPPPGSLTVVESASDQAARANLEVRLSQMEMDMQTLTGRAEEISYQVTQLQDKLDRTLADLEMRVAEIERGSRNAFPGQRPAYTPPAQQSPAAPNGGYYPDQSVSPPASAPGSVGGLGALQGQPGMDSSASAPVDSTDPTAVYEAAFALVRRQDFDSAERALRGFLDSFPSHQLAPNAMYWLGETYYVRGQYETAARVFAEGYQKYPQGAKAADNLLKMGLSLAGMGSTKDACVALGQLQREFPTGAGPIVGRAEQEMTRLNCASLR